MIATVNFLMTRSYYIYNFQDPLSIYIFFTDLSFFPQMRATKAGLLVKRVVMPSRMLFGIVVVHAYLVVTKTIIQCLVPHTEITRRGISI